MLYHSMGEAMKLAIILGDQLNLDSPLFGHLHKKADRLWMAEVPHEASKVWSHRARIVLFLSAMRHFYQDLKKRGYAGIYHRLDESKANTFADQLLEDIRLQQVDELLVVHPGEYSVLAELQQVSRQCAIPLRVLEDTHFICQQQEFAHWFSSMKQPRLEFFYRHMRKQTGVLMQQGKPQGGAWNFDKENRKTFAKQGPGMLPAWPGFSPDKISRDVIRLVKQRFADHPGSLAEFDWPVCRDDALIMLDDFIEYRLAAFGPYQDAMWRDEAFLYHSGLSAALNLKLLNPREVIDATIQAYQRNKLPLASVEGFIRQILGWREYVRGVYWQLMPDYVQMNSLNAQQPLPDFYWNADTDMQCLQQVLQQTLEYGYAHHIQRLMVTGLFALLLGVKPQSLHEWYLAVYVDAVEWVELPNTLGMSQYADAGIMASKPYVASGKYIQRMSNYCDDCPYDPQLAVGEKACPFTTLYWDFLQRHEKQFSRHPRTALQWRNLQRFSNSKRQQIKRQAQHLRKRLSV